MSDTATELLEMDIEPLTLDDSTGRGRTLDDVTALVFPGIGISMPRVSEGCLVQLTRPDDTMAIGFLNWFETENNQVEVIEPALGDIKIWFESKYRPKSEVIASAGEVWVTYARALTLGTTDVSVAYARGLTLSKDAVYSAITNYDAILERPGNPFVSDGSLFEDPLRLFQQPGGFEPGTDLAQWSEARSDDREDQPEVAVELDVSFPPIKKRTVIGSLGSRLKPPFETAFSTELAELDGI